MFSSLQQLPTDPILGLMGAFKEDTNPNKIELGVGVYKDEAGHTPVLRSVKLAEKFRLENETTKTYIGLAGNISYNEKIKSLLFGEHNVLAENRVRTVQTPGGTGALRVAADFIQRCKPNATIWVSSPTWANHTGIFQAANLNVEEYPYYDYETRGLQFENMMTVLKEVPAGDVVLLHACCHNPSGVDLNNEQWKQVAELAKEKGFMPLIDCAYQGFGTGLDEDVYGLRLMAETVPELIVCSSCSKNFGLYRDRVGACSLVAEDNFQAEIANSVLLNVVRCNYSMPPAHGAALVDTILGSDELTGIWLDELAEMRDRIRFLRTELVNKLKEKGVEKDFRCITEQNGMFSFFGINKVQIELLRANFGIYMVGSSRMNVASINSNNINYFADSVASVLKETD